MLHSFGRETRRRHGIPVAAYRLAGEPYALTDAPSGKFRGATVEVTPDGHVTRIRLLPDDPAAVAPAPSATSARRAHRLPGLRIHAPGTPAADALTGPARRYHPCAIRLTVKTRDPRPAPGTVAGCTGTAGIGITG